MSDADGPWNAKPTQLLYGLAVLLLVALYASFNLDRGTALKGIQAGGRMEEISTLDLARQYSLGRGAEDVVVELIAEKGEEGVDELIAILNMDLDEPATIDSVLQLLAYAFPSPKAIQALEDYAARAPDESHRSYVESLIEVAKEG